MPPIELPEYDMDMGEPHIQVARELDLQEPDQFSVARSSIVGEPPKAGVKRTKAKRKFILVNADTELPDEQSATRFLSNESNIDIPL